MTTEPYDPQKLTDHARQLVEALSTVSGFLGSMQTNLNFSAAQETRASREDVEYYSEVVRNALLLVLKPYDASASV